MILKGLKEYKLIFKYWFLFLSIGLLFRAILFLLLVDDINIEFLYSLLYGIRMDTIVFSAFGIIFTVLYALNLIYFLKIFLTILVSIYLALEISTIAFMDKFFSRPNYLFIEHLNNYNEIFGMVWELYKFYLIIAVVGLVYFIYKVYLYFSNTLYKSAILPKLIILPFMIVLLLYGTRSSIGAATPNQGFYTFSQVNLHNEIANNSIFSILYATYLLKKEKFYAFGKITSSEAISNLKSINNISNTNNSLIRFQKSLFSKKKNIILVMLESFGSDHIGYLGGTPTTPVLDNLTKQSLYFTNLYATGTRTSWGVSSIITSLYPIPSREYVKASKSQKDFYTIAKTLKNHNYENTFLYSGDADFDNMRGFLLSNGYDNVYGKESFSEDKHKYTWGYSDEDLYDKTLSLIEKSKNKPYFITLLTMSSHEPFDYPKNKVEPYKKAKLEGFANSIKYSDYAIGKFMDKLKQKGILKNTVVAFIADHSDNSYGSFDVPVHSYKIAALIVSDDFKGGKEYDKIASQIDFAPTILDIAGISDTIPSMGSSVLQNERDSALLLANRTKFAYLLKDQVIIYKDNYNTKTYDYNLTKIQNNRQNIYDGLSYIYSSKYLYNNKHLYNIKLNKNQK